MDKRAYLLSSLFHGVILLLMLIHIPLLSRRETPLSPPIIPIEIVTIGALSASPPKKVDKTPDIAKTKMETTKSSKSEPTPAKLETPNPTSNFKKKLSDKPKEKVPDLKTSKEHKNTEKKDKKKKQEDDFMSVMQAVDEVKRKSPHITEKAVDRAFESENISDKLTISELDALRQQLQRCWNVPAGALNANELAVVVKVTMGPDAIVRHVEIVDSARMQRDPYFRTAAESAKRALFSPKCTPLKLPKDRYDQWQTFEITFNPKELR